MCFGGNLRGMRVKGAWVGGGRHYSFRDLCSPSLYAFEYILDTTRVNCICMKYELEGDRRQYPLSCDNLRRVRE